MNAMEARMKSYQNRPKLVEANFYLAISSINNLIKTAVNVGQFTVSTRVNLSEDIQDDVVDRIVSHYEDLGYKVAIYNCISDKKIYINWSE